jgi:hypothetical protein
VSRVADVGDREARVGAAFVIENVCELDSPPPGAGLNTVTLHVPAAVTGCAICNDVGDTYVVATGEPLTRATVPVFKKPVPVSVIVTGDPEISRVCVLGERSVRVGTANRTSNDAKFETTGPGLITWTEYEPGVPFTSEAGTVEVINRSDTQTEDSTTPLISTVADGSKFAPLIAMPVAPLPCTTFGGTTEAMKGPVNPPARETKPRT